MVTRSEAFSGVVFACSDRDQYGCLPIDNNRRKVLRQIDGHRSQAGGTIVTGLPTMEMQEVTRAIVSVG